MDTSYQYEGQHAIVDEQRKNMEQNSIPIVANTPRLFHHHAKIKTTIVVFLSQMTDWIG